MSYMHSGERYISRYKQTANAKQLLLRRTLCVGREVGHQSSCEVRNLSKEPASLHKGEMSIGTDLCSPKIPGTPCRRSLWEPRHHPVTDLAYSIIGVLITMVWLFDVLLCPIPGTLLFKSFLVSYLYQGPQPECFEHCKFRSS